MKFYTLIHICRDEQSLHNNSFVRSFTEQINLYFTCARQLHTSLKREGLELVVLTNDKAFLDGLNTDGYGITVVQLNFTLQVPSGVKFYSPHFKIEVYRYLATLEEDYVGLIDSDMVCINPMPESFKNIIRYQVPLYYDITTQVAPAYGESRIIADKQLVSDELSVGLWAGGEFIAGPPRFFEQLYAEVRKFEDRYFRQVAALHHQSDEVCTSVAVETLLLKEQVRILDAGAFSIVGRFWSPKTLHVQNSIEAYKNHFLLHLPSDKKFIMQLKPDELQGAAFFRTYKNHLVRSRLLEGALKGVKPYLKSVRNRLAARSKREVPRVVIE